MLYKTNDDLFFHSCDGTYIFIRRKMKCSIQLGFASLNRTFHLSPHEDIYAIALITIHYLCNISTMLCERVEGSQDGGKYVLMTLQMHCRQHNINLKPHTH